MPDPSVARFTYRAFISYSHRDEAWARWLHRALETYRVPSRLVGTTTGHGSIPRRLNPVFRDRDELSSAPELGATINAALAQSENLIVICSPAAAASHWVNEEVLAYKRLGRAARIFCLIAAGEPNATDMPGRAAEECFCPALRFQLDAHGQPTAERTEPIAADARPGKDGKPNAKLKLIAGMLDVGFDALKQREQHRRMRRMAAITALAVCVMAVTIVLAIVALVSRHRAVIAQHEAVVAKQVALRRQKQAENLVDFMLGDLNDKLAQVARLDIMQAVDDKAMDYFKSLPNTDVTPAALAQRAKALEKIGVVRMDQGHLPGAMAAFHASTDISSKLAAAAPTNVARQLAYARTLSFVGLDWWYQGKLANAQQSFEAARRMLRSAQAYAKSDLKLKFELQDADNNIGHVLEARDQPAAAEAAYRQTLQLSIQLTKADPDNTDWVSALGDAHNNLGKLALLRGDMAAAITEYRADDAIETRLSAQDPKNNSQRENMLRVRAILGRTLALAGDIEVGQRDLRQAVDIAEQLAKSDPHAAGFSDDAALYATQLARLNRLNGNLPAANALSTRSIAILSTLVRKAPNNGDWQNDYAAALTEQAAQSHAAGHDDAARSQVQAALRILEPTLAKHPDERDTLLATMQAKLLLADLSTGSHAEGSLRQTALNTMQAQTASKNDPRLLALEVEALLALGRKDSAKPLVTRLWHSGYRDLTLVHALQHARIAYPVNSDFQARLLAASGQADAPPPAGNKAH